MIPRLLHSIWIGSDVPQPLRVLSHTMQKMNPAFTYKLHGEELLERYASDIYVRTLLANKEQLAFVADRLRVLLLKDEGGVYVDIDALAVKSFSALSHCMDREQTDFLTGMRSPFRKSVSLHRGISFVDNTVMASAKNGRMVNRLARLWTPKTPLVSGYNIGLEVLDNADTDMVLLGYKYFYAEAPCPEAVILHDNINLGSWCANRKPAIESQRKEINAAFSK